MKEKEIVPVSEMSIGDVIQTPLFFNEVSNIISDFWQKREKARANARENGSDLKAHVIDKLHRNGDMRTGTFIVIFANVLNKSDKTHSGSERNFIREIGLRAFNTTMIRLLEDEKKRNDRNREDKQ